MTILVLLALPNTDYQTVTTLHHAETFPCYIEYNQRTGKYKLYRHKALYGEDDSLYDYLLSAYHIEGMTELALKHRDKIILSEAPTGVENGKTCYIPSR